MTFYRTVEMDPQSLREAITQAKRQEDAVLAIFQRLRRPLTPSDVLGITQAAGKRWPLTSIRRAMSDLTKEDGAPLVKTDTLRKGLYHLPEHAWVLATQVEQSVPQTCEIAGA